jgi:hypothetical protein
VRLIEDVFHVSVQLDFYRYLRRGRFSTLDSAHHRQLAEQSSTGHSVVVVRIIFEARASAFTQKLDSLAFFNAWWKLAVAGGRRRIHRGD